MDYIVKSICLSNNTSLTENGREGREGGREGETGEGR